MKPVMSWNLSAVESECGNMVAMRGMVHGWIGRGIGVLLLLGSGGLAPAASDASPALRARLAEDGRSFCVTAPGLIDFQAHWSVNIKLAGKPLTLTSATGTVVTGIVTAIRYPESGVELLFRLEAAPGDAGVMAQAGLRNTGTVAIDLISCAPVRAKFQVNGDQKDWLVTRLDTTATSVPPVVPLRDMDRFLDVVEFGGFYRRDGAGFLFGPVGTPVAYVSARLRSTGSGDVSLLLSADMSGVRVDPGETRWGQQVALVMEKPQLALAHWADWVARTHGARTDKGALAGWNSWNTLGRGVTGPDVLAVAEATTNAPNQLRPAVIQIDDGYQDPTGQAETNEKFPGGLAYYAQRIATAGARPGLFLSLMDSHLRAVPAEECVQRVERAVRDGYTYLKLLYRPEVERGGKQTVFEKKREKIAALRRAAGENIYLLSSHFEPDRALVGAADASRTGVNTRRTGIRSSINDVLRSYHLQGRWFAIDNDGYYLGTDIANLSQIDGGWPLVRTWMSMVGLSCGLAITSDPWNWDAFRPLWRNVEVMTPPAKERTEVLDLCTSEDWPRLIGHVHRDWGDWAVALLWNPATKEQTIKLDFARAGLDPHRRYAVWSFWDDRYLGVTEGSWTTPRLGPSASQHLSFTALDQAHGRPVLIGSNLHIYCGAAEIKRVQTARGAMTIELTDAGARDGDLFVYSRYQPVLKKATGCLVDGIPSAGENAWRISLHDRQSGTPQRIELAIILPVTQQVWFWGLIAIVVASLAFAAWRYVVGLRLERANALERERARIARDIHDDLGAGLTEIAMLSDVVRQQNGQPAEPNSHLDRIFRSAQEMTQTLDEIVWAVNPANDTLDKFVSFAGELAQTLLTAAGIRCRLEVPATVPHVPLPARIRHALCRALKEALHNILKHARAHEVHLRLSVDAATLRLVIEDDGVGFDPAALRDAAGTHDGLVNMHRRMQDVGGTCAIESAPGQGTRVRLEIRI